MLLKAAVVLLQLDHARDLELALEVGHVAHDRAPREGVDALVVVADREHAGGGGRWPVAAAGEQLQPRYCSLLVSWNSSTRMWREAAAVVLAQRGVVAHQLDGAQHQLGEVDRALALALRPS